MKRIIVLMLIVVSLSVHLNAPVNAAANSTCGTYGFTVDTRQYDRIGYTDYLTGYAYRAGKLIGTSNTIIIFATQKTKVGSKNMNVAMYYTIMSPKNFTAPNIVGIDFDYTGKTDSLEITTKLNRSVQSYRASFPENVAGSSSYTLGGSAGLSSSGINVGVTGSTTITKNRLDVINKSNVDTKTYKVLYEYDSALIGWDSTNSYLKNASTQRGTFYYLTDGQPFSFPITVKISFGAYWGMYHYSENILSVCECDHCRFPVQ